MSLKTAKYQVKETIVTVIAEECYHDVCLGSIKRSREDLERHILEDPFFKVTFEPYDCPKDSPLVIRRMAEATAKVGVGPMAAVAGTIAWIAVEDMAKAGAGYAIVDNGGDIALINDRTAIIGIYAGESPIKDLGLEILPRKKYWEYVHRRPRWGPRSAWEIRTLRSSSPKMFLLLTPRPPRSAIVSSIKHRWRRLSTF